MDFTEKTVRRNYIYRGKILSLRCDDAARPDGKPCKREIVEHSGGAAILCVVNGKVVLVRQYRYAYGEVRDPRGKAGTRGGSLFGGAARAFRGDGLRNGLGGAAFHALSFSGVYGRKNIRLRGGGSARRDSPSRRRGVFERGFDPAERGVRDDRARGYSRRQDGRRSTAFEEPGMS